MIKREETDEREIKGEREMKKREKKKVNARKDGKKMKRIDSQGIRIDREKSILRTKIRILSYLPSFFLISSFFPILLSFILPSFILPSFILLPFYSQ